MVSFDLIEIGRVVNDHTEEIPRDYGDTISRIRVNEEYREALLGIEEHSHLVIVAWLHKSDRKIKQVHPMKNTENPLTGVFATRSPVRPNPLGITVVELIDRDGNELTVKGLDFFNDTPVVDIKGYSKHMIAHNTKAPDWKRR